MERILYINKVEEWTTHLVTLFLLTALPLFTACDKISEEDRLIVIEDTEREPTADNPESYPKNVLIEDFTGQLCVNCPKGAKVIKEMLSSNIGQRIVPVGIYSGPFGKTVTGRMLPLTTQTGCDYYDYWKVENQPGAMFNRSGNLSYDVLNWNKQVSDALNSTTSIKMETEAVIADGKISIAVSVKAAGNVSGKLQVWIVEDDIVALQTIPDDPQEDPEWTGGNKTDYIHEHVFRAAVNNPMGDDFTVSKDEEKVLPFSQTLEDGWNKANLSVVAIIYNDNGVEQVVKGKVKDE